MTTRRRIRRTSPSQCPAETLGQDPSPGAIAADRHSRSGHTSNRRELRAGRSAFRTGLAGLAMLVAALPGAKAHDESPGDTAFTTQHGVRIPYGLQTQIYVKNCEHYYDTMGFHRQGDPKIFQYYWKNCAGKDQNNNFNMTQTMDLFHPAATAWPEPGKYEMVLWRHKHNAAGLAAYYGYSEPSASNVPIKKLAIEIYRDRLCRDFTTTARYVPLYLNSVTYGAVLLPQTLLTQFNNNPLAYFQLKGNWCYYGGTNYDQVVKYQNLRLETAITGGGLSGLVFKIRPGTIGSVITEPYGGTATRYKITGTTAIVSVFSPVEATLSYTPPAGVNGPSGTVTVPANTTVDLYTLRTDTLLSGQGNGSCAGTRVGPCEFTVQLPTRFF